MTLPDGETPAATPEGMQDAASPPTPPQEMIDLVGGGDIHAIGGHVFRLLVAQGILPEHRILDIGRGCGPVAIPLTGNVTTGSYDGLDVVESMVAWCRANLGPLHQRFRFHHASLRNTNYSDTGDDPAGYRHAVAPAGDFSGWRDLISSATTGGP